MLSLDALREIVREHKWDDLQEQQENLFLDCKSQPYALSNEDEGTARSAKAELAKDVSSFANREGGFILLGFQTRQVASQSSEIITSRREIPLARFDKTQYLNVVQEWVYPSIDGLDIRFEPGSSPERGIGVIEIPPQGEDKRPFLIKREVISGKLSEIMVGHVERIIDNSIPTRVEDLHRYVRDGRLYHKLIRERFESIEELLESAFQPEATTGARPTNLDGRIREIVEKLSLDETSILVISASIENTHPNVLGFLSRGVGSIHHLMSRPPQVRNGGFMPGYGANLELDRGQSWLSLENDRAVAFYRDGTLLSILPAHEGFLCHGAEEERGSSQKINTLVLTESVFVFLDWYFTLHHQIKPNGWAIQACVDFRFRDRNRPYMVPYAVNTLAWETPDERLRSPESSRRLCIEIERNYDPGREAFRLLQEIYAWFGVSRDNLPYTNRWVHGNRERFVDPGSW